jgi:DNA-binding response OmpR family regulator
MLKLLLEGTDYCVLSAANGNDAFIAAARNQIDLLLTDFNLPDMIGPAVVRRIRELPNGSAHIPAIMVTAVDSKEHRTLAAEAGCEAFLVKPLDFDVLTATIERLLLINRREKTAMNATAEEESDEAKPQGNSLHGNRNVKVDPCPTSL